MRQLMKRLLACPIAAVAAVLLLADGAARAADPTTADCLGASDASLKYGNQHKLRAERAQLLVCAAQSCPADIRKECVSRVSDVNAQIPTVIFSAKDAGGSDLTAVKVSMDGEVLAERLEGTALSIDPGEHTFTFETAGQPPVTKKMVIVEAQKERRELVTFGAPASLVPPPNTQAVSAAPASAAETSHGSGNQRVIALVAGGIGVVGLGLGTAFAIAANSQKSDAQNVCPNNPCPTQDGVDKWNSAGASGNASTIAFIAGGVAAGAGLVLWLTAPSSASASTPQVGIGPGVVQVKGSW
jgi:hypothetical protein